MLAELYIHLGVLLAGMASFLSPCVLPLVPPYLGYLGGTTVARMGESGALSRASTGASSSARSASCWASRRCSSGSAPAPPRSAS